MSIIILMLRISYLLRFFFFENVNYVYLSFEGHHNNQSIEREAHKQNPIKIPFSCLVFSFHLIWNQSQWFKADRVVAGTVYSNV